MTKKTTPTPAQGLNAPSSVHAMRRGGTRREVTERVSLKHEDGTTLDGWALNVSRGGLRAILEEKVLLGQKFEVAIGTDDALLRPSRVVWVQEELDGVIVGLEFLGLSGLHKAAPPAALDDLEGAAGDPGGGVSED